MVILWFILSELHIFSVVYFSSLFFRFWHAGVRDSLPEEPGEHYDEERGGRGAGWDDLLGLRVRSQLRQVRLLQLLHLLRDLVRGCLRR